MPKETNLSIDPPNPGVLAGQGPISPQSPRSPPVSGQEFAEGYDAPARSPITSLPPVPSPNTSPNKGKPSKSIFGNIKASKSAQKLSKSGTVSPSPPSTSTSTTVQPEMTPMPERKALPYRRSMGSTPELKLPAETPQLERGEQTRNFSVDDAAVHAQSSRTEFPTQAPFQPPQVPSDPERRPEDRRHRFRIGRKASMKEEDILKGTDPKNAQSNKSLKPGDNLKVTPSDARDRGFRDMMGGSLRNRSADRSVAADRNGNDSENENASAGPGAGSLRGKPARLAVKDDDRTGFFSAIGNRAADGFGRAGKALVKLGRSGSSHEKEKEPAQPPRIDPNYKIQILNQSLVEQTRRTRISKRLEDCKDKTEFWMPALPWRCIDFLNANGVNTEGIYRVPGSDRQIKAWEHRFDTELDIDLLRPDVEIYDINVISSLLKSWLRGLPEPILTNEMQDKILKEVKASRPGIAEYPSEAPDQLRDALSSLPPFQYYLLFALTCHISLLNTHHEVTKMPFANLQICLQPALKLSAPFFTWLVEDWRNCWQGCWTEKDYLLKEYEWLEEQANENSAAQAGQGGFAPGPGGKWTYGTSVPSQAPSPAPAHTPSASSLARKETPNNVQAYAPVPKQPPPRPAPPGGSTTIKSIINDDTRPKTSHTENKFNSRAASERSNTLSGVSRPQQFDQSNSSRGTPTPVAYAPSGSASRPYNDAQARPSTSHTSGTNSATQLPYQPTLQSQRVFRPGISRFDSAGSDASSASRNTAESGPGSRGYTDTAATTTSTLRSNMNGSNIIPRGRERAMEKGLIVQVAEPSRREGPSGMSSPRGINGQNSTSPREPVLSATSGPLSPAFPIQHPSPIATSPNSPGPRSPTVAYKPQQSALNEQQTATTERRHSGGARLAPPTSGPTSADSRAPQLTLPPQLSPMKPLSPMAGMDYGL